MTLQIRTPKARSATSTITGIATNDLVFVSMMAAPDSLTCNQDGGSAWRVSVALNAADACRASQSVGSLIKSVPGEPERKNGVLTQLAADGDLAFVLFDNVFDDGQA